MNTSDLKNQTQSVGSKVSGGNGIDINNRTFNGGSGGAQIIQRKLKSTPLNQGLRNSQIGDEYVNKTNPYVRDTFARGAINYNT